MSKEGNQNITLPSLTIWGWIRTIEQNGKYYSKWEDASIDLDAVLVMCSCKSAKCKNFKCSKRDLNCIEFCECNV